MLVWVPFLKTPSKILVIWFHIRTYPCFFFFKWSSLPLLPTSGTGSGQSSFLLTVFLLRRRRGNIPEYNRGNPCRPRSPHSLHASLRLLPPGPSQGGAHWRQDLTRLSPDLDIFWRRDVGRVGVCLYQDTPAWPMPSSHPGSLLRSHILPCTKRPRSQFRLLIVFIK